MNNSQLQTAIMDAKLHARTKNEQRVEALTWAAGGGAAALAKVGGRAFIHGANHVTQGIKRLRQSIGLGKKSKIKTLKEQAEELILKNQNKHRVTLRGENQKIEIDLAGKSHGNIPTPHTKASPRNFNAPKQPSYNTKKSQVRPATQDDIRKVRKFLEIKK